MLDSSLPPVTQIWVTLSEFLPQKGHVGWFFRKTPEIRIKQDQMLKN
jgi:hypothetical protein